MMEGRWEVMRGVHEAADVQEREEWEYERELAAAERAARAEREALARGESACQERVSAAMAEAEWRSGVRRGQSAASTRQLRQRVSEGQVLQVQCEKGCAELWRRVCESCR